MTGEANKKEAQRKEVEALAASLNHSAERAQTLWLSFLTFTLYLAIAAGTTTHRMLFREDPLTLPVLNIQLPLIGFYVLAPIIFVVVHFYVLLNLMLLARTAKSFDDALTKVCPAGGTANEMFRMRIENTLFVQLLVGGRKERKGFNSWLLSVMALITLAIAPVALLVFIQVRFLPYHSEWLTWTHRGLLIIDLALVCTLWPGYRSGWGAHLFPERCGRSRCSWCSARRLCPMQRWRRVFLTSRFLWRRDRCVSFFIWRKRPADRERRQKTRREEADWNHCAAYGRRKTPWTCIGRI